ncbi:MAG: A/G-specific adenine glycosylase [Methylophaga sp.]|nr:A/G-specific adenine glycosylase [Methylophaga sp.]
MTTGQDFSQRLLDWFDTYGRKNLPWQQPASPYRVWLSEIMLQQTQVTTVIPYFLRFTERFPDISSLANTSVDEVLTYWAGLGYYARGRNLHKAAQLLVKNHQAALPADFQALVDLPGIGRSTAGAIMALAFKQPYPILDGNVKRVLARYTAESRWPGEKQAEADLWQLAARLLPKQRINDYIQAQMDLGATLCTRSKPRCEDCPLNTDCQAFLAGTPTAYPISKPKKAIPSKQIRWLVFHHDGQVLLEKRPVTGIWGGLWSFPEMAIDAELSIMFSSANIVDLQTLADIRHAFTHFRLTITPLLIELHQPVLAIRDTDQQRWVKIDDIASLGLPSPAKTLVQQLARGF